MSQQNIQVKTRIEYIDLAKGICIFFVVFFHFCQLYGMYHNPDPIAKNLTFINDVIGVFRMPLYFFLSGCFFKSYKGFFDFIKRKTNKLLIPFVFSYIVFSFVVPHLTNYFWGGKRVSVLPFSRIFDAWLFDLYPSLQVWFLLCLFWMGLIFYGIYSMSKKFKHDILAIIILSIMLGALGIILGTYRIELPANIDTALTNIPYYMAGYIFFRKTKLFSPNKLDRYLLLLIPVAFAIDAIFIPKIDVFNNHFTPNAWISMYPCGLLGVLAIILLAKKIKKLPILSFFGRYSIIILITHYLLLQVFNIGLRSLPISTHCQLFLNLFLTLSAMFIIIPLARKYMPYVFAQKDVFK